MADESQQPSQEEIQRRMEMAKQNCIFCKIANKEMDAKIVFEDDICMAILDIQPASTGHLLLLPKEHYMLMPMVPDEVMGHLSVISKYLTDLLHQTFSPQDVKIMIANGAAAGQQSQHFMMHIIPIYKGDELQVNLESEEKQDREELEKLATAIREKLTGESGEQQQ